MIKSPKETSNKVALLIEWLRGYANNRINSSLMDARRSIPPNIVLDFGNKGLLGLQAPVKYGGLNLNNKECMAILSQVGAIDLSLAIFVGLHNCLGIRPIMNYSQDNVKQDLLPKLASGRELSAFALTEPSAGSNASAIEGEASQLPNGKVKINCKKMWIGNASWAGIINVFVRYRQEGGQPHGVSGYIIRQGQGGLEMGSELMTMGLRGMVQNAFTLKDVIVDPINQLGEPGKGMSVAQDAMMHTRLALGAIFLGAIKRTLQIMLRYADRRMNIATGKLLENPITMMRLSKVTIQSQLLEHTVNFVSQTLDQNISVPEEFLITTKVIGSEFLWEAVDTGSQMLGGRSYLENNEISRILRDARVGRIFEGPTETMMHYMGTRFVMGNPKLIEFISTELNSEDISEQLIETAEAVTTRCKALDTPFKGVTKLHLAYSLIGEIVCWGILNAIARNYKEDESLNLQCWANKEFEDRILAAKKSSLSECLTMKTDNLKKIIGGFKIQVGDIQQTLPGEEWSLDSYLNVNN